MKHRIITTILIALLTAFHLHAQSGFEVDYPKVGEPIKDHTFTELENFPRSSAKVSDFRGKWLILDLWAYTCGGCRASFPKMDRLAQRFKKELQLIMVGLSTARNKHYERNKILMAQQKKEYGFSFTVAYDTAAMTKYDAAYVPYILVVNPEGIIVAKCTTVNEEQIAQLITGNHPPFNRTFSKHEKLEYDPNLPLLVSGNLANGGSDTSYISRSILLPYSYKLPLIQARPLNDLRNQHRWSKGTFEVSRITLKDLYKLAYFGVTNIAKSPQYGIYNDEIELNVNDSSKFSYDPTLARLEGWYAYSVSLPKERITSDLIKETLRDELKRTFGFKVSLEKRPKLIYSIAVTSEEKAKAMNSTSGTYKFVRKPQGNDGFTVRHASPEALLAFFRKFLPKNAIFINESNILHPISFDIDIYEDNLDNVNAGLSKYGLEIISSVKDLVTIVISN